VQSLRLGVRRVCELGMSCAQISGELVQRSAPQEDSGGRIDDAVVCIEFLNCCETTRMLRDDAQGRFRRKPPEDCGSAAPRSGLT
jgi:hypothetical protein